MNEFRLKVITAINKGLYKPSDLLYYFEDFNKFKSPGTEIQHWPTPGAISLLNRKKCQTLLCKTKKAIKEIVYEK